tara:strand:+ start:1063 stop:1173 length:111 start_codon:yes stop_codon:yes gene_type:complete
MKKDCYLCVLFAASMTITAFVIYLFLDTIFVLQMPH